MSCISKYYAEMINKICCPSQNVVQGSYDNVISRGKIKQNTYKFKVNEFSSYSPKIAKQFDVHS